VLEEVMVVSPPLPPDDPIDPLLPPLPTATLKVVFALIVREVKI
jgi:hypothetical protein